MVRVHEIKPLHSIAFQSSGSRGTGPRDLQLEVSLVRYEAAWRDPPVMLATADLQGREVASSRRLLGELLADEISVLQELGEAPAIDLCLLCGDFYDYPDLRKLGGTGDVTLAFNALSRVARETLAVLGNHDTIEPGQLHDQVQVLDANSVRTSSLTIGGVSGIVGNPRRNNRKTETEFLEAVRDASGRADILLLHQGPEGDGERQRGWGELNKQLRKKSGRLVLFGHCHWPDDPLHTEGGNLYCNVDGRAFLFVPIGS